ncbi:MAG: nitroreductase family protein [Elusimicrobiota bacterium]|jgi:predicted oxidoreductase (fatty acid repression mutant protein)|nr:nitroreductase family protein [Elusimicrobiota bacterium]
MHDFYEAVIKRRSIYALTDKIPFGDSNLRDIVEYCVKHSPSPFNMQSQRAVILLGQNHAKLWDIVMETLRAVVPAAKFAPTERKVKSFAAAHGTILYYTDGATVAKMQAQFPPYRENFSVWAQQCMGMLQYAVWAALAAEGIGANLQHYNPLIDAAVQKQFDIPKEWQLSAQMPFGLPAAPAGAKDFLPIEERVKVFE